MRLRRVALILVPVLIAAFGFYLWGLYGQLKNAFNQEHQFIPTRFYSDVTRIAPPQTMSFVNSRLQALGYTPKISRQAEESVLSFNLHSIDYPVYLLPDNHPTLDGGGKPVLLHFDGSEGDSLLNSIELAGHEVQEIFLEPELVATLSRAGIGSADAKDRQIRQLVQFADIPANVWKAIISVEDPHFLEHRGVDPRGIARAIWVDLRRHSLAQGGSTLTLQLVKNLTERKGKNLLRKANEIFLALLLEATYDKERILERYLNEVYLGQAGNLEVHGVAEGAEHFFGKKLEDLNLAEITFMAGLIRGPAYYSPYTHKDRALERGKFVLKKMVENGQIAEAEAQMALKMPIRLAPPQNISNKAPYFNDFVKAELIRALKGRIPEQELPEAGLRVYTTLDLPLNTIAQKSVAEGIAKIEKDMKIAAPERLEGALACVDPSNGYIRALIGGRNYAQSGFNRILNMKRQVGSTFKPFVYLTAISKHYDSAGVAYGPAHPALDAPWTLTFDHGHQSWAPKNYEKEFLGWIDYRKALAHSINTVAAKLGYEIGIENVVRTAHDLGIQSELPAVPSLALGVAELSPIELLRAYAAMANHGIQDDTTVIRAITKDDGTGYAHFAYNPRQVIDAGAADLITEMMRSVFTEGTAKMASDLGFDRPAAGKTGTTSHHRDAWFAGYTPQLVTVVWTGMDQATEGEDDSEQNPKTQKKHKRLLLTGATSALPIWADFMKQAHEMVPVMDFPVSPNLADYPIDRFTGELASSSCPRDQVTTEKYLKAFEPKGSSCASAWPPAPPEQQQ